MNLVLVLIYKIRLSYFLYVLTGFYCNFKKQKTTDQLIYIPEQMFELVIFVNDSKTLNLITEMDTFQASVYLGQGLSEPSVLEVGFVD